MYEFKLPDLGEGIHEGEVLKWYVQPGDVINEDDPLVDVETDKAAVTIPSPKGGRVASINGDVGQTIEVGTVIAVIDTGDGAAAAEERKPQKPATQEAAEKRAAAKPVEAGEVAPSVAPRAETAPARPGGPVLAAPATRRLARELDVDIARIQGSGPAGRVTPDDVKRFAEGGAPRAAAEAGAEGRPARPGAPVVPVGIPFFQLDPLPDFTEWGPVERRPVRSIRRKVARKMVTSMILAPHVAHMDEADVTELEAFRRKENARRRDEPAGKLTLLPFVMKAVTLALREAPEFNASMDPFSEEIVLKKFYNVGFAADTGKGLIVPVVKNTDQKSIAQISAEVVDLATRARQDKLQVTDLRGGTFTITNVGAIGGTGAVPTINYPEVAILAMGRAQDKPVVRDGAVVVRTILPLVLTFDHRVVDGADAARFVTTLVQRLSEPLNLLLDV